MHDKQTRQGELNKEQRRGHIKEDFLMHCYNYVKYLIICKVELLVTRNKEEEQYRVM